MLQGSRYKCNSRIGNALLARFCAEALGGRHAEIWRAACQRPPVRTLQILFRFGCTVDRLMSPGCVWHFRCLHRHQIAPATFAGYANRGFWTCSLGHFILGLCGPGLLDQLPKGRQAGLSGLALSGLRLRLDPWEMPRAPGSYRDDRQQARMDILGCKIFEMVLGLVLEYPQFVNPEVRAPSFPNPRIGNSEAQVA